MERLPDLHSEGAIQVTTFELLGKLETCDFGHVPTKDLERGWLLATCLYEQFDKSGLSDARWDALTAYLFKFRGRLSPYFTWCVPIECLQSSTGSGIDWKEGIPALNVKTCLELIEKGLV